MSADSLLKAAVDTGGITPIFVEDKTNANPDVPLAELQAGSALDLSFTNTIPYAGTWTLLEVENGAISNNGLAFAAGVDTNIWSFAIDNSGSNGLLTISSSHSIVNTLADEDNGNLNPTNGTGVSLREAIAYSSNDTTITFASYLGGQTILLTSGQLLIDKNLDIDASAIGGITIDGNGSVTSNRIFEITAGTTNLFNNLTLTNGLATGASPNNHGGAILVNSGAVLTLENSTLSGNTAADNSSSYGRGGGIYKNNGALIVNNSTFTGNTATLGGGINSFYGSVIINHSTLSSNAANSNGGGIFNNNGTLTLHNSTLSGNTATIGGGIDSFNGSVSINHSTLSSNAAYGYGGGIYSYLGSLTLHNSTLSGNTATLAYGGGIYNDGGTLHATNSIIAGNMAPTDPDIRGALNSDVNNLTSGDPQLAALGDYGGPTQTLPPLPDSPAIDTGLTSATNSLTDQRGFDRVNGAHVDIGAVEFAPIVVTSPADSGAGTFRQAITDATFGKTIAFTNTLAGQTILLTSGQLLIDKNLNIDASAIGSITINGNANGRIFEITEGTTSLFQNLTLTNGIANNGGGIYNNGMLTLNNCTLFGNTGSQGGGIDNYLGTLSLHNCTLTGNTGTQGGGIFNNGTLTLHTSTLSGNMAFHGGGIYNYSGTLSLHTSTLSGNTATIGGDIGGGSGGGIYNNGMLTLHNSTLSGNTAIQTGGIYMNNGTLNSTNSIIAGNTFPNILGALSTDVNNLTSGTPQLAALGNYGGPTQTMPPLPGSPAIDAGLTSATNSLTDQRGMARVLSSGLGSSTIVDIGAVEFSGWLVGADLSGMDTNHLYIPTGTMYDSATIFPAGFDPIAAGLLKVQTQAEIAAQIAQGEANVTGDPEVYGLYSSNAVLDLAVGDIGMEISGTNANLELEMWQSDDLGTWTNAGDTVYWSVPVDSNKKFFRVRANP